MLCASTHIYLHHASAETLITYIIDALLLLSMHTQSVCN